MKILGVNESNYRRTYVVEISHEEIEKVMNKCHYNNKLEPLKADTEFDIAAGYNFKAEIVSAIESMRNGHERFAKATQTMIKFIDLMPNDADASKEVIEKAEQS